MIGLQIPRCREIFAFCHDAWHLHRQSSAFRELTGRAIILVVVAAAGIDGSCLPSAHGDVDLEERVLRNRLYQRSRGLSPLTLCRTLAFQSNSVIWRWLHTERAGEISSTYQAEQKTDKVLQAIRCQIQWRQDRFFLYLASYSPHRKWTKARAQRKAELYSRHGSRRKSTTNLASPTSWEVPLRSPNRELAFQSNSVVRGNGGESHALCPSLSKNSLEE